MGLWGTEVGLKKTCQTARIIGRAKWLPNKNFLRSEPLTSVSLSVFSQTGVYTISLQAKGEIKHIRVTNTADGKCTLGKSKTAYDTIWDLIEGQLDQKLKSTSGEHEVQLV